MAKQNTLLIILGVVAILALLGVINIKSFTSGLTGVTDSASTAQTSTATSSGQIPIDSATFKLAEKYSNSYAAIDGLYVNIYNAGTNPKDPTATAMFTCTLVDGICTNTQGLMDVDKKYRMTVDSNGTSWYSLDFGDTVVVNSQNYNKDTGKTTIDLGQVIAVATIDDVLDEVTNKSAYINGGSFDLNCTSSTTEICGDTGVNGLGTADKITYDDSAGDGSFYIEPLISFSGANKAVVNPVLCFTSDRSNPDEGNEFSAITVSKVSGDDFGIPSDVTNVFVNHQCIKLGNEIKSGSSARYKFTFTVTEANTDTSSDLVYMDIDDIAAVDGKDAEDRAGATRDTIGIYFQA